MRTKFCSGLMLLPAFLFIIALASGIEAGVANATGVGIPPENAKGDQKQIRSSQAESVSQPNSTSHSKNGGAAEFLSTILHKIENFGCSLVGGCHGRVDKEGEKPTGTGTKRTTTTTTTTTGVKREAEEKGSARENDGDTRSIRKATESQ